MIALPTAHTTTDKQELRNIIEASYSGIEDLRVEYEGQMLFPRAKDRAELGPGGVYDIFSGTYMYRHDGSSRLEIYHRFFPKKNLTKEIMTSSHGTLQEIMKTEDQSHGAGTIRPSHFTVMDKLGSIARIISHDLILGYLRDETWKMTSLAPEAVDGHPCEVVLFEFFTPGKPEKAAIQEKCWIDLNRGGCVLRRESYFDTGAVRLRLSEVALKEFKTVGNRTVWIPISGVFEAFESSTEDGKRSTGKDATNREEYKVLIDTVRLNRGIPDNRFTLEFRDGTPITDQLRRIQYEFGQFKPEAHVELTREETAEMLDQQLKLAKAQGGELLASSAERAGAGWVSWVPWVVATLALLSFTLLLLSRRRSPAR